MDFRRLLQEIRWQSCLSPGSGVGVVNRRVVYWPLQIHIRNRRGQAMLPDYLAKAVPNPMGKRAPWYANTAPTYAGIFLWIAFYQQMAGGTLQHGGLALCLVALAVAGILSYALYYRVPAMLGMKTGFPLYVAGSSTL